MLSNIDSVLKKFQNLENHTNFFIRERIYKGSNSNGNLSQLHGEIFKIKNELKANPLPNQFLQHNEKHVNKVMKNVNESLDLLINLDTSLLNKDDVNRFYSILDIEITEIKELIRLGYSFEPCNVESPEVREQANLNALTIKIEDNVSQIYTCYEWRRLEGNAKGSGSKNYTLEIRRSGLETALELMRNVNNLDCLQLLCIIFMKIRSEAASNLGILDSHIPLIHTLSRIFSFSDEEPFQVKINNKLLRIEDIKIDVEHKLNTGKLEWLVNLHETILQEVAPNDFLSAFAENLYTLSRDRRKEFLWSMSRIAREERNPEIEDLSIKFANLSTSLISIVYSLKNKGYNTLSEDIKMLSDISAIDAVTDMVEIYQSGIPNVSHMIKALRSQLDKQKEYAFKILEINELKDEFIKIVKFTDMDFSFNEEISIENYLRDL